MVQSEYEANRLNEVWRIVLSASLCPELSRKYSYVYPVAVVTAQKYIV